MRISEILVEYSPAIERWRSEKMVNTTRERLEAGETVDIVNAGFARGAVSWGTLKQLGFAKKEQRNGGRTTFYERWVYTGPEGSHVKVIGGDESPQVLASGEGTDWIEIDYS